ncbi:MAG: nickel pincer cofactor biosynthesis protein LarC [Phycisphaerae bacterium]|nr:nickel pincer cofactor biosynthesis protein LarC [Phycisphaerae bacterium]NUQ45726.1 nickel pincer cofactor biosynthesis protein LarC [Phycisphaerae bacterium]
MRIGYFDCFSGAAGDMIVAALLDAGCPQQELLDGLASLRLSDARIEIAKVKKQGFAATRFVVHTSAPAGHRHLKHIREIIAAAALPPRVAERALAIFKRLAQAEAEAHGTTIEKVHFHEVGAADAIIDIVGAALAVELLRLERIICSFIPTGSGAVRCEHGLMPVPAPGTAALLRGAPIAASDEPGELTTPTGAAVLTTLADAYGPLPEMSLSSVGYGAGTREGASMPNLLRIFIGESAGSPDDADADVVVVLEAQIDDATGEQTGYARERLIAEGALDVYATPVQMKKGRPGVLLTVLCAPDRADTLEEILFVETTTFGVRRAVNMRHKLARSIERVPTPYGDIGVKVGRRGGRIVTASPEYEDCARAARAHDVPLRDVMAAARRAYDERAKGGVP